MKLLIDTGCFTSILKPSIVEKYYPELIYHNPSCIKTSLGEKELRYRATIPAFSEFNSHYEIEFLLFDFHEYFDGILGLNDLLKMNFSIDLPNQTLTNNYIQIPFYYRQPHETSFTFEIPPHETLIKDYPVSIDNGEIIIPECSIDNLLYIPETVTNAKNGRAYFEIYNYNNKTIVTTLDEPLFVYPLNNNFEIYNFDVNCISNTEQNSTNQRIDHLIRSSHMNPEERTQILKLCNKFKDIFHTEESKLTFTNQIKHEIKTTDEIPVHAKSYRFPHVHKPEIQKQINQMLNDGIIRQSSSPWSSPIWIVPKKLDASGKQKWRIVVDYRKINEKTIDDRYPIPNIDDILDKLGKCNYFSTLDLASGFYQIEMHKDSISKTAFNVENGHYEYLRMPMGLKNAPATFQKLMDHLLRDLQGKICLVYMDDIIIFSTSLQEHISNLKLVFSKLRDSNLKIQLDKSEFFKKNVEFLGHVITPGGIKPNPNKIKAVQKYPIPKTAKEIKSFLGLVGYYRRFIKNFAHITKPLTQCLKKNEKIIHTPEFVEAFEKCKSLLTNAPILQFPDFSKPFILTTDASNVAIGAVLSQGIIGKDLPIAYASRTLNPAEQNFSTIERELCSIVNFTKLFRPYIFGRRFTIVTDHKPLQWLFNLKEPNSRLVRWRLKLEEYDYEIVYKRGKLNTNADALSRIEINPLEAESVIANCDDSDQNKIINDFPQSPEPPDLYTEIPDFNPADIQPLIDSNKKVNILQDIRINNPDENHDDENHDDDNETLHSAVENPILEIKISEKSLNCYKNQIILFVTDNISRTCVQRSKLYNNQKTRINISLPLNNLKEHLTNVMKEYFVPKTLYAIHFRNKELRETMVNIIQTYFKHSSFKLIECPITVRDVEEKADQLKIIKYHHEGKTSHKGINETSKSILKSYYWPDIHNDVTNYINTCEICQKTKYERHPNVLKFRPTPIGTYPFEHIYIDTFKIKAQPFLTIIDSFSRFAQAYPTTLNAIDILDNLLTFISHFGLCKTITCDNGSEFKNQLMEQFCQQHKITLHYTTPYNPNSNSPVERFHSTLLEQLRALRLEQPEKNIKTLVKYALIGYNNTIHSITKFTPFQVAKGNQNLTDPFDLSDEQIVSEYLEKHVHNIKTLNKIVNENNQKGKRNLEKINTDRKDPKPYDIERPVYLENNQRNKILPKFKNITSTEDDDYKIKTSRHAYHKSKIKPERKLIKKSVVTDNAEPGPSHTDH